MKISWRGARAAALMTVLSVSLLAGCSGNNGKPDSSGTASTTSSNNGGGTAKGVGSVEQDQIFELEEFKTAKKQVEDLVKAKQAELEKKGIKKDKPPTPPQQQMLRDAQAEIQKETAKILNPLKARAEAAVANVAHDKNMLVILDKRIVVYGVPDITDDVKKTFQTKGELKLPPEADTSKAPIGYFDQSVVRSLKLFSEADANIYKKRAELMASYQAVAKNKSASERELMERELRLKLEAYQEQVMQPLIQQVNDSVKDVAQAQGLSLVLDKQHVMQGGRNMTNEVVEAFLKRAGVPTSNKPKASATPGAASPTPGAP